MAHEAEKPTLLTKDYHVACICALPIEMAAVNAMLDQEYGPVEEQDPNDHNSYSFGKIHKHNIVVACLPGGVPGIASAATVAKDLLRTFKNIRFGFMVGIGSGIPDLPEYDIRLGDVVVSQPTPSSGGVIQYDSGVSLNAPPNSLLNALTALQARHEVEDSVISSYIQQMLRKKSKMKRAYGFPGPNLDHLFLPTSLHQEKQLNCDKCDKSQEVQREFRENTDPQIHYGIVASGSQIVQDPVKRDQIKEELKAICLESEAAGLMNNFPCLIIRGICDYADSHQSNVWSRYASATAAAFVKELLQHISPGHISHEKPIQVTDLELQKISAKHLRISEEQLHISRTQLIAGKEEELEACHRVFQISPYQSSKDIIPTRSPGTCKWVLDHKKFQDWKQSKKGDLLWISADPGCGKSVLSKFIVDSELRSKGNICYFFFKDAEEQDRLNLALCGILHQLFIQNPSLRKHALKPWKINGDKVQNDVDELWDILLAAAADPEADHITCIIDALDECQQNDRRKLIRFVTRFYNDSLKHSKESYLKFFVTSRPYRDIEFEFLEISDLPAIRLAGEHENDSIREEINIVIGQRVDELGRRLKLKSSLLHSIHQKLLNIQHRTYLWLALTVESIYETYRSGSSLDANTIQMLPSSVEDAYEKMLQKINKNDQGNAKTIFHIIIGAKRPLTVSEAAQAYEVTNCFSARTHKDITVDIDQFEIKIRELCKLFLFINHSTIHLIHQTAKEFLVQQQVQNNMESWKGCLDLTESNFIMAKVCLTYLLLDDIINYKDNETDDEHDYDKVEEEDDDETEDDYDYDETENDNDHDETEDEDEDEDEDDHDEIEDQEEKEDEDEDEEEERDDFLRYAAENWPAHFRDAYLDQEVLRDACRLYDVGHKRFKIWYHIFAKVNKRFALKSWNEINLAAFNGHTEVLKRLLVGRESKAGHQRNSRETALVSAAKGGHDETVCYLLESWADLRIGKIDANTAFLEAATFGHGKTMQLLMGNGRNSTIHMEKALRIAAYEGQLSVVNLLIEMGVNINDQGEPHGSALIAAISNDQESVTQLLVNKGADINSEVLRYGTALEEASSNGNISTIQLLIDNGANVNGNPKALVAAIGHKLESEKVVQLLLDAGADANQAGDYGTALRVAAFDGLDNIIQLLLDAGADVNQVGEYGTALQAAALRGLDSTLQLLLNRGADVNLQKSGYISTPLQAAAYNNHKKTLQLLLNKGADVNAQCGHYGTALQAAAYNGHNKILQLLLDAGTDANLQAGKYGTALQAAATGRHNITVQLLLSKGAEINSQGGLYCTALQAAAYYIHDFTKIQIFLDHGADVNIQGGRYWTALQAAAIHGRNTASVQLLLNKGADANLHGGVYGTALQAAAYSTHESTMVQMLLDHGADASIQGGEYGTALQAAAKHSNSTTIQLLLEHGADVNCQGGRYGTALHAATDTEECWHLEEKLKSIRLLLHYGADVNLPGGGYDTVLERAKAMGNQQIIKLIKGWIKNKAIFNRQ